MGKVYSMHPITDPPPYLLSYSIHWQYDQRGEAGEDDVETISLGVVTLGKYLILEETVTYEKNQIQVRVGTGLSPPSGSNWGKLFAYVYVEVGKVFWR